MEAQGEFARVKEKLENAIDKEGQPVNWGTMAHDHDVYMLLVEAALQSGDVLGLKKFVPELEQLARRDNHRLYLGIALRARGVLNQLEGDLESAQACLQKALDIFRTLDSRWQCGRTCFVLGKLSSVRGDGTLAGALFSEALSYFDELGAAPDRQRVTEELERIG